jgi:acetyltransferase-like isoleucine patch superfamily enzyme
MTEDGERDPAEGSFDGATSSRFLRMGHGSRGRPRVLVFKGDRHHVSVGCYVSIADGVDFHVGGNHRVDWVTTYGLREIFDFPGAFHGNPWSSGDIVVGSGASLGRGAKIMSGITIGEGAAVAPFSVVTRDVRPYAIVVGSPAREIGRRFDDGVVESLRQIDWATWPAERIRAKIEQRTGGTAGELFRALSGRSGGGPEAMDEARRRRHPVLDRARHFAGRGLAKIVRAVDAKQRGAAMSGATDVAADVTIGRATYFPPVVRGGGAGGHVTIGSYSSIAQECELLLDPRERLAHDISGRSSVSGPSNDKDSSHSADVSIGSDVWLGQGAKILPGITVGDGAVVAAWSVVTADVAAYAIVGGNPAREIRRRFDEQTVEALLRIRWWDWPEDDILSSWQELCSPDVEAFVERHDPLRRSQTSPASGANTPPLHR